MRAQASIGLMIVDFAAGRYTQCDAWARTMIENSPEHIAGHLFLTAALSMQGEVTAAAEARGELFQNLPFTGELAERVREALRKVGIPET